MYASSRDGSAAGPRVAGKGFCHEMVYHTPQMVRAYIMVKTAAGKSEKLLSETRALTGVEEGHIVAGQYDIVVEVSAAEVYDVMHSVATDIRDLDGVADTRTYISLE